MKLISQKTFYSCSTFVLTFLSYALFHATRKSFSNVKSTISEEWSGTAANSSIVQCPKNVWNSHLMFETAADVETYLGILDAVFMLSYAVGLYISGILGDRFELRKVLAIGMCSTAIVVFIFGSVLEWTHTYNKFLYVGLWIVNGLLQSSGWPTVVAIMGNWFGKSSRGLVLGLWSACASVGNIIGALMVSQVLHYGYDYAFLVTSTVLFAGGVINFFGLVNSPKELDISFQFFPILSSDTSLENSFEDVSNDISHDRNGQEWKEIFQTVEFIGPDDDLVSSDVDITVSRGINNSDEDTNIECDPDTEPLLVTDNSHPRAVIEESDEALSFRAAICLPGVILYALAYFCLKLVNYSFFFWLPYYLSAAFGWKESVADKISIWYDIGGIFGGTIAGLISDCFQKRSIVVIPMLVCSIPALVGYSNSPNDKTTNAVLMTITGYFTGGVANLISAAISADLGKQGPVQGSKKALATVTGIVDGTGSMGAALGQILVPLLQEHLGWHSVFYLFVIMTVGTILCIMPLFVREFPLFLKDVRRLCQKYRYSWYCGVHTRQSLHTRQRLADIIDSDDENT